MKKSIKETIKEANEHIENAKLTNNLDDASKQASMAANKILSASKKINVDIDNLLKKVNKYNKENNL